MIQCPPGDAVLSPRLKSMKNSAAIAVTKTAVFANAPNQSKKTANRITARANGRIAPAVPSARALLESIGHQQVFETNGKSISVPRSPPKEKRIPPR